ncbi:TPA: hypothetical protein U8251_000632 [Pseudomonas putida]|nr:hypothetical protein [Pseudomonas putida]
MVDQATGMKSGERTVEGLTLNLVDGTALELSLVATDEIIAPLDPKHHQATCLSLQVVRGGSTEAGGSRKTKRDC